MESPFPTPPPTSEDEAYKKLLHKLLSDPDLKRHLVTKTVESEAKSRSKGIYYRVEYAEQLKPFIDQMIREKKEGTAGAAQRLRFKYESFPGKSPATVHKLIEQATRYLVSHMDTEDNTYFLWRQQVEIQRGKSGVLLVWKDSIKLDVQAIQGELVTDDVGPRAKTVPKWKDKLDDFINDPAAFNFQFKEPCDLTEEEIKELAASIEQLNERPGFPYAHSISPSVIRVIKMS